MSPGILQGVYLESKNCNNKEVVINTLLSEQQQTEVGEKGVRGWLTQGGGRVGGTVLESVVWLLHVSLPLVFKMSLCLTFCITECLCKAEHPDIHSLYPAE